MVNNRLCMKAKKFEWKYVLCLQLMLDFSDCDDLDVMRQGRYYETPL